jgi:peroxiredoxin
MSRVANLTVALAMTMILSGFARGEAKVGAAAPAFSLQDQSGKSVSLADFKGKIVVLEWFNNECPYVVKHYKLGSMNALASKYAEKGVVWLAINSTKGKTNADNAAIAESWSIKRPILNDADGATGRAYGATRTPQMYIINAEGNIAYMGAIDSDTSSDPSKVEGATNYVAAALDELLAGKTVSRPETKPYGCTVKYAK